MLSPLIRRAERTAGRNNAPHSRERGVTILLVAVAMVAIIGMAALSIDIGTLYEAKAEAQRAADAAALAAARVISISGITGDPNNAASSWQATCGTGGTATLAATAVAQAQWNFVGKAAANNVKVTYGTGAGSADCSTLVGTTFSVNPIVKVYVQQATLPTFFGRVFSLVGGTSSNSGVSATATAEVYNPSGSGSLASSMIPVQPRCVKPWIIPNIDPGNAPNGFVNTTGTIVKTGISPAGVVGENFNMNSVCKPGKPNCVPGNMYDPAPTYNKNFPRPNVLEYGPAWVQNASSAVPTCTAEANWTGSNYQQAIAGCDQTTVYACGTPLGSYADLTGENPVNPTAATGDTATGAACLTNAPAGADTLAPLTYPFQITMGAGNPLSTQGVTGLISTSNSIATIPIYDYNPAAPVAWSPPQQQVTILGFLQVFINFVDPTTGDMNVTVMNVAGCSNAATAQPVAGTSPVPVRLITPP